MRPAAIRVDERPHHRHRLQHREVAATGRNGDRRGSGGGHAGARRYARAHQRARAHRVGRLRDRHARGGGRRRHHAGRHAAQQHSRDDHRRGARGEASRGGGTLSRRCRILGRRRARQRRRSRTAGARRRARLQVLSQSVRCRRIPERQRTGSALRDADRRVTGLPLLAHAEWPALLVEPDPRRDPRHYSTWLRLAATEPPNTRRSIC